VAALAEMYVQGVSTRKVKAITEELCGHGFSAAAISAINTRLDQQLAQFAGRRLDEACPYLILDARYERVREAGVIRSQAVLLAIGIGWDGRRSILAVELANRESRSSWREFLLQLRERGLSGVEFVVSDDHAGLRQAIVEVLPEAAWQRCYVHFLRNALDDVPRKVDDDCLRELRWLYDRRDLAEAKRDLAAWLAKWQATYPKLCSWVEEHIEETLTFYRLPRQHHKHLKSTDEIDKGFVRGWYAGVAWATAWRRARRRLGASPGCLIRMNRRGCGARAPAGGWCHGRERGAASALQPGWRGAPRGQAAVLVARRFMVGLGCHWATKC
jgi:putative transposase